MAGKSSASSTTSTARKPLSRSRRNLSPPPLRAALHSWPCHTEELNLRTEPCSRAARTTWRVGIARGAAQQNCLRNAHRPQRRDDETKRFNDKLLRTEIVLGSAKKLRPPKSFTIQRGCFPKRHALLLVPVPVVRRLAKRTVVISVRGASRCRQTTRTNLPR